MLVAKVGPGARDEAAGLRLLRGVAGGPPVPEVVLDDDELVVTTAIDQVARTSAHDESFGHTLATLHTAPHAHWGGGSSWIGACQVDASTRPDGATFYGARLHELASRCGLEDPVERVVTRLPVLLPPDAPALLHGDLWWGNVLFGADGRTWLIDPSVHGGHPEEDLAMLALFGTVPDRLRARTRRSAARDGLGRAGGAVPALPAPRPYRPLRRRATGPGPTRWLAGTPDPPGLARPAARRSNRPMATPLEFWLYLPQMRLGMDDLVRPRPGRRGRWLRRHGRHGPPGAARRRVVADVRGHDDQHVDRRPHPTCASAPSCCATPSVTRSSWPSEAVTIDRASGGRFELGIGWGSVTYEFEAYGIGSIEPRYRVEPAQGVARDHDCAVARRSVRLRRRALHPCTPPSNNRFPSDASPS